MSFSSSRHSPMTRRGEAEQPRRVASALPNHGRIEHIFHTASSRSSVACRRSACRHDAGRRRSAMARSSPLTGRTSGVAVCGHKTTARGGRSAVARRSLPHFRERSLSPARETGLTVAQRDAVRPRSALQAPRRTHRGRSCSSRAQGGRAAGDRDGAARRTEGGRGAGRDQGDRHLPHRRVHALRRRSGGPVPRDPRPRRRGHRRRRRPRRDERARKAITSSRSTRPNAASASRACRARPTCARRSAPRRARA